MSQLVSIRRSLASSAVCATVALVACGVGAAPASAEPGNGNGGASQAAPGHTKGKGKGNQGHGQGHQGQGHQGQGHQGNNGNGHGNGHQGGQGNQGGVPSSGQDNAPAGNSHVGGAGDPAGNNGTVKIAGLGELDGIPNNTPHPGCTFQVEWYGFDEGADVVSQVSFAMHAPTDDVALSVAGDTSVFVGGDPASGAGTDTGLDGVEAYTLTFDGAPHPKQGYHLKLTVATPRSQGNDTKTKVFWVEPCETAPVDQGGRGDQPENLVGTGVSPTSADLDGRADQGVLGTQAEVAEIDEVKTVGLKGVAADADSAAVPLRVDAGEAGALRDLASSPLALIIAGLGILLAMAGAMARRRTGAAHTS